MLSLLFALLAFLQEAPARNGDSADSQPASQPASTAPAVTPPTQDHTETLNDITSQALKHLGKVFSDTPWMGWIVLFAGILGGLIGGKIVQTFLRRFGDGLKKRGWVARGSLFIYAAAPASLALFSAGLVFGFTAVVMDDELRTIVTKAIGLLNVLALAWFFYNLVDLIEIGIRRITTDDTILQLIRKALRIFLLIIFGLFVAENFFGANISAWLAGLGLAGLAVSLAAQGPIKNIFGSITVVLDRPFGLGDRIRFGDTIGVVEVMGFRSTKLRTLDGHLVTIPNSKLIEDVVENIAARPYIRRQLNVTITYDTPPEKVERAVQIIKDLLALPLMTHAFNLEEMPPRVYFNNFNADSLNIAVTYWYQLAPPERDWWTYNAQSQEFNLKLLRAYNSEGIDFAFPSQTIYLAGDANRELAIRLSPDGNDPVRGDRSTRSAS